MGIEATHFKCILALEILKESVIFNHSLIIGLIACASHNSENASFINSKAQRLAEMIVENEILHNKSKIIEHTGLKLADVIMIDRKEVKKEKVNRKVRNLDILK